MTSDEARGRMVRLDPPREVVWIANRLAEAGFEVWAVGGAVRDALAGDSPGDWDLTTSARPADVRRLFRRTVPLGIEHGTVGVIARGGKMYEVTTFRRDVETFGRRARVVFADRLEDDLGRRDFTMNAIAWHPLTGEIRDPFRGFGDLEAGILRTVGDPDRRFEEDRLRVLRALRFAGRFNLTIEPATWKAIQRSAGQLGNISAERIREELKKVLSSQSDPTRSLRLYAESGVLQHLYPELEACRQASSAGINIWGGLVRAAAEASAARFQIRVAALLHDVGRCGVIEPAGGSAADLYLSPESPSLDADGAVAAHSAGIARSVLRRLRFSNAETDLVTHLIAQREPTPSADAPDAELRRWIRRVGPAFINDLFRLLYAIGRARDASTEDVRSLVTLRRRTAAILASRPALRVADLAIGGSELGAMGIPPGPRFREILDALLERVLEQPELNQREVLLDLARELA